MSEQSLSRYIWGFGAPYKRTPGSCCPVTRHLGAFVQCTGHTATHGSPDPIDHVV